VFSFFISVCLLQKKRQTSSGKWLKISAEFRTILFGVCILFDPSWENGMNPLRITLFSLINQAWGEGEKALIAETGEPKASDLFFTSFVIQ
jgi:hypothetical protein